jgi:FKBP-type peptidyl-prolyl cis-trans isomerase SlyD
MGGLLPGSERALEGKREGDTLEVVLPPSEAFGKRSSKGVLEVDREEFPPDVHAGDRFELENEDGGLLVAHVLDVQDEIVLIYTNHPLSDQEVRFRIEVREVRPATSEEISAQEALMNEDTQFLRADVPDISPGRLIRGAARG